MMLGGFIALAFGFCAGAFDDDGAEYIAMGLADGERCHVRSEFDPGVTVVRVNGHAVVVEVYPTGGGHIVIDGQAFAIPKTQGA